MNDTPILMCVRCDALYRLPIDYNDCNEIWRDLCPSCLISKYEEELEKMDTKKSDREREFNYVENDKEGR